MIPEERERLMEFFQNDPAIVELLRSRGVPYSHPRGIDAQRIAERQYLLAGGIRFTQEQLGILNDNGFRLLDEWDGLYAVGMARRFALIEDVST